MHSFDACLITPIKSVCLVQTKHAASLPSMATEQTGLRLTPLIHDGRSCRARRARRGSSLR
jgi:hypothetical protein